jgi:hypothetical protein
MKTSISNIMKLFQQLKTDCTFVDVDNIITRMNNDIANLKNEYTSGMVIGIINPFFKTLDTAVIVSRYVEEYTSKALSYRLFVEHENVITLTMKICDEADNLAIEISKISKEMKK